jgi:hypothetical protein
MRDGGLKVKRLAGLRIPPRHAKFGEPEPHKNLFAGIFDLPGFFF